MQRLRAGKPLHLDRVTLIPIERIEVEAHQQGQHLWLHAGVEAHAVVICEAGSSRAVDVLGKAVPVAQLDTEVEGLAQVMAECNCR